MNFNTAKEFYRTSAGDNFWQPDSTRSWKVGTIWRLRDNHGKPVAIVDQDGVIFSVGIPLIVSGYQGYNMDDYKTAVTRFKLDAGPHYVRPVKKTSHYSRGGWYLIDRAGNVVCIVGPDGCLWGARLAYYFNEGAKGIPAITRAG
jgi:hypothetical protein